MSSSKNRDTHATRWEVNALTNEIQYLTRKLNRVAELVHEDRPLLGITLASRIKKVLEP